MTLPLIDKQDNFEIVRDQIALLLFNEVVRQMALATAAAKDPADWKLRIFSERGNVWEQFLKQAVVDKSPLVNVWYSNSNFPMGKGDTATRQKSETIYHIDCYGYGESEDTPGGGHVPGDRKAAYESHRAVRLVRNILMAGENRFLQLARGTIMWGRWPQSITAFQPSQGERTIENIVGSRFDLMVGFNEFPPAPDESNLLEEIGISIRYDSQGQVIAALEIDTTVP